MEEGNGFFGSRRVESVDGPRRVESVEVLGPVKHEVNRKGREVDPVYLELLF